ncbi:MAG: N(5)-(carboxyethyl)ornithine synthase [Gemmatimonadota bacterium]
MLKTGIPGTSRKENEKRVPVHPAHLERIPPELRGQITLQCGYGAPFGVEDQRLTELGFPLADRDTVLGASELVILPKPIPDDLARMAEGAVLWGWPHAVQQRGIAQVAIDRRLTLLAFEAMFQWDPEGTRGTHVFHRNNELAGYCGILDALRLTGLDGSYGRPRRTIILSFGSVSRGAAHALKARGFTDITALTLRPPHLVQDQQFGVEYGRLYRPEDSGPMTAQPPGGDRRPLIELLADADVIVNGTLQNPENPLMFVREGEEEQLRPRSLIVDVSCDEGMGFHFARPTTFEDPMFTVGDHVRYYAVDHTPSYLWDAASWEISNALLPYLPRVAAGPEAWDASETLRRAIEIRNGTVRNPVILSFQNRAAEYPHPRQASEAGA